MKPSSPKRKRRPAVQTERIGYTMIGFTPLTSRAERFLRRRFDALWSADTMLVDHRYAAEVAGHLERAGLRIA